MIGAGIRLSLKEDGSMWLRVLSRYPVFIRSTYLDREAGMISGDAVHKIYPGTALKVCAITHRKLCLVSNRFE